MAIRELTDESARRGAVPILRQLWSDADPADVLAWTAPDDYHRFGRFVDDEVVEPRVATVMEDVSDEDTGHPDELAVDEPRRGAGHGTALLEHVEAWATERDCESIALASPLAKADVHQYYGDREYEKWGYVIEKQL